MAHPIPSDKHAPVTTLNGSGHSTPVEEYASKLTTPARAVSTIKSGSTLCLALSVGMPGGLAKAVSERVLSGDLKDLNLYYQHSMKYSEETLIRPDVLPLVNARCFFMGDPDRKMVKVGLEVGKNPRVLSEYVRPDTFVVTVSPMDKSGHFSLGTCWCGPVPG